ncbi:hypothetical protein A3C91_04880 [Candidatus Azambacteria bacterium RIFCSPHIGHO2_02_FULL_52_12]|uniref:HicB-like antitoxin of toxin-antitoxin system domain-containing protein n=1 Tax=Candidatus Azambacteria bacterium RIFCSPLOWO2_01_FULL_46_25 TaxID=1797298 RepID=A0A1F5BW57_9BACT|nr:MAG: hypothetical protein A3C91_04880 [Candidatus Azambacteria bacterium RIFCSPHIGHO2_02_FULL_52_12]OGD34841.1 MAG: hypothetical protein A2988_04495 [Candidatus Azambacteria bacterium RIFCSPLOWO2_01_FULL_46_25]OGD37018.1 MAG: hypothetical protein A2850_03720 [Candidatus Azambacteria bacterium RIFCSPHIGHO2_01_FULL_51_74]
MRYKEHLLKSAHYEYSKETDDWCAYIEAFPGVYAQQDTVEEARKELDEILEEYILLNLAKGLPLPHFEKFAGVEIGHKKYAKIKSRQSERAYA